jgi:twitching motility protein PilT
MTANETSIEHRARRRARSVLTTHYRMREKETGPESVAATCNFSGSGVAFEADENMPVGTELSLSLVCPSRSQPVRADGRITRIEELEPGKYRYGVQFQKIDLADQQMLEKQVSAVGLEELLRAATRKNVSDVHLIANSPAMLRLHGELVPMEGPPISTEDVEAMILSILPERQRAELDRHMDVDFSYLLPEGVRFRVNAHVERGTLQAALRVIPSELRSIAELGLPPVVEAIAKLQHGLVIVCGPTGSGKSTTLAAILDAINRSRSCMIISIEDPIEQIHTSRKSVIKQREVGVDTTSFSSALKHVLRQDPNVIMVGEMRDTESISMAITAAETGHLLLTTLHTAGAAECLSRIVDVYPSHQQAQIRTQLAECLQAVISQTLLPTRDGSGRVVAVEVLIGTPAVRNLIRMGQPEQINSFIVSGGKFGMISLDDSLAKLVASGAISVETARAHARNPSRFI